MISMPLRVGMLGVEEAARVQAEGRARESVYFQLCFAVTLKLLKRN